MDPKESKMSAISKKTVVWRGIRGLCPKCGQGRLFVKYIALKEKCSVCFEELAKHRADDGPAWLTILLTGHIMVPFLLYISRIDAISEWQAITVSVILTIIVAFVMLPFSKGLFISVLWLLAQENKGEN
ncbi:MAG: DUF983 domain-containing protein [Candidatus Nucleicultricaceae bacterium]